MSSIHVSARLDIQDIATMLLFFKAHHITIRSRSHFIRECLSIAKQAVVRSEDVIPTPSISQSINIVKDSGLFSDKHMSSYVLKELAEEDKLFSGPSIAGQDKVKQAVLERLKREVSDGEVK